MKTHFNVFIWRAVISIYVMLTGSYFSLGFPGLKGIFGLDGLKGQKGITGVPGTSSALE